MSRDGFNYLELREEAGGERHYVDGVAIHAGDPIRVLVGGEWVDGRYEANWRHRRLTSAWFYFSGGSIELTDTMFVEVPR